MENGRRSPVPNTKLFNLRDRLAQSQEDVADALNALGAARGEATAVAGNHISRWERGIVFPSPLYRQLLAEHFQVSVTDLGLTRQRAIRKREDEDDMKRRQLLAGTATGLTVLARPRRVVTTTRVGLDDACELTARADGLLGSDQRIGGGKLVGEAIEAVDDALMRLEICDVENSAYKAYAKATGTMAVTAGWLAYDADDQASATHNYREALTLAARAGDDQLAARTFLQKSLQTLALARRGIANAHSALNSTLRAADLTNRHAQGRIHALIASRQAAAHACLGNADAFRRSIASAQREMDLAYDHEPPDTVPDWLKFVSHTEVRQHEATGYADLGMPAKASELFGEIVAEYTSPRNAVNYRAWLAASLARVGDIDQSIAEATTVTDHLTDGVFSHRTMRVLEPVRAAASGPRHEDFRVKFDQLAHPHTEALL